MTSARIRSEFSAPVTQQLRFPFCSCGATILTIEKTATCAKCGQTLVREGMRVKVGPTRPDGRPHPHAGETGSITKFINIYSDPYWLGLPSAMLKLDSGIRPQGFIWVSLVCLEVLPENAPGRVLYSGAAKLGLRVLIQAAHWV
jgi:hypothetical protein